jgi:hypothetical protein
MYDKGLSISLYAGVPCVACCMACVVRCIATLHLHGRKVDGPGNEARGSSDRRSTVKSKGYSLRDG